MYCAKCQEPIKDPSASTCPCGCYVWFEELDERQTLAVSYQEPAPVPTPSFHQGVSKYVPDQPKPKPSDEGIQREAPLKGLLYHEKYVSKDWKRFYSTGFPWLDDEVQLNPWWAEAERKDLEHRHEMAKEKLGLEQIPQPKYQLFLSLAKDSGANVEIGLASSWEDVDLIRKDVEDGAQSGQFASEMERIGMHPKHVKHIASVKWKGKEWRE